MHGQGIERRWITVAGGIPGYAVLRQRGERTAGHGTMSNGRCGEGDLVLWLHSTALLPSHPLTHNRPPEKQTLIKSHAGGTLPAPPLRQIAARNQSDNRLLPPLRQTALHRRRRRRLQHPHPAIRPRAYVPLPPPPLPQSKNRIVPP